MLECTNTLYHILKWLRLLWSIWEWNCNINVESSVIQPFPSLALWHSSWICFSGRDHKFLLSLTHIIFNSNFNPKAKKQIMLLLGKVIQGNARKENYNTYHLLKCTKVCEGWYLIKPGSLCSHTVSWWGTSLAQISERYLNIISTNTWYQWGVSSHLVRSSSASKFNMLCEQRCSSSYFRCSNATNFYPWMSSLLILWPTAYFLFKSISVLTLEM